MKACPLCSSTYDDRVDFCFRDGAPLVAASPEVQAAALAERGVARFTEALDVPEPRSLHVTDAPEPSFMRPPFAAETPDVSPVLGGEAELPREDETTSDPLETGDEPTDTSELLPPDPTLMDSGPGLSSEDRERLIQPVPVPPPDVGELTEPDTTDFFAGVSEELDEDEDEAEELDEDEVYGGIPYAETPQTRSKLPLVLGVVSVLLIVGAVFAFGGGGGDPDPAPNARQEVAQPEPVKPKERAPAVKPPEAPEVDAAQAAVQEAPDPESTSSSKNTADASETSSESTTGGNGIGSVDRATERERKRQERREEQNQKKTRSDQAAEDSRQEAERRKAERRKAERREAERQKAEAARSSGSSTTTTSEAAPASNPWGQADDASEGTLRVDTTPQGASVWIDDAPRGKSPVTAKLPFGSHKVRVTLEGHKDKSMVIDLQSERRDLAFNLPLDVRSGPVIIYGSLGAEVYLGSVPLGPIPVSTTLQEGTYTFTVVQEGTFYKVTKTLNFENVQGTLPITLTAQ